MKYQTLEYNMNSPCLLQVVEPLDSTYGLAVRIVKNGQVMPLLAQDDIVVDGQSRVGTLGTWQLFELSTGSVPCTKRHTVGTVEGNFNLYVNEVDFGYMEVKES